MRETPDWSPGPCAWALEHQPDGLTYCSGWRKVCEPKKCERRKYAARRRAQALTEYRKFPGNPFQVETKEKAQAARASGVKDWQVAALPKGHCRWCGGPIWSTKKPGEVHKQRTWHNGRAEEPDCLWRYYLHTRAENQLTFLVRRDGPGCRQCGKCVGRWAFQRQWVKGDPWGGYYRDDAAQEEDGPDGPFCRIWWSSGLQVDHILALALVVIQIPEARRWRFFGPTNLQGLCHACHVEKTRADVVAIKAARITHRIQVPAPVPLA